MELEKSILSQLDTEAIAHDTLEFLRVKSETGTEGQGSLFLAELMRREGLDVTLDEFIPGRPNVYALLPGARQRPSTPGPGQLPTPGSPNGPRDPGAQSHGTAFQPAAPGSGLLGSTLLFNGHTDTIPIGRSTPPARDGEWVVGRGAEDMKGGLVAMVHAAAALKRAGVRLYGDLWLTGVVGHETPVGKKEGPLRLIERLNAGEIRADAIVIVEGPSAVWSASLGSAVFSVTIRDPRGPIHTLHVPYRENPAACLGRLLTRFGEWEARFEGEPAHALCGRARINVGTIHGGDYMNRLPTPLAVTGQRRWLPGQTCAEVLAEFQALCRELAEETGLELDLAFEGTREPFETPADHPVVGALTAAGRILTGTPPDRIGMALVGDANLYANQAGIPTVYYGPAYKTAHSDDERVLVERLYHCAGMYALTALHYCGHRAPG